MADKLSKKQFNKTMQELEKENKAIDVKMSKYYQSPTTDRLDTTIFNVAFILLNMLVIVFLYLYYSNQTYGVYSLSVLQDVLNESNLILNLICYALGVVVLKILINAITLKCNTGNFRFGVSSRLCLKDLFYNSIGYSANTMYKYTMTGARIKLKKAENIVNVKSIGKTMFNMVVSIVLAVVSLLYVELGLNVVVVLVNFIAIIIYMIMVGVVLVLVINKDSNSTTVFHIAEFIYKIKLVKDFDFIYNLLSLKVISLYETLTNVSKNAFSVLVGFLENLFLYLIKVSAVVLLLETFDLTLAFEEYMYVLISINIMDNICRLNPIKNKTVLKELMLCILFTSFFNLKGYVFYFILIYIVMDYYVKLVVGFVLNIVDEKLISKSNNIVNNFVTKKAVNKLHKKTKSK
ncbi:MAG: hypothetical protein J6V40_03170 [Clostridia bacterium]|nr:hypothetical protein [Clostridia bacterium]